MARHRVLTGITTTGTPHLGNYVGAIRPAIESSKQDDVDAYLFLADYHALIKSQDPNLVAQSSLAQHVVRETLSFYSDGITGG